MLGVARRDAVAGLSYASNAINRIVRWRNDPAAPWATVAETLARGEGGCKDIAVVKFWTLKLAGRNPDDLRLLAVTGRDRENHMVVVATAAGARYVLDNREIDAVPIERYRARPIYAPGPPGLGSPSGPADAPECSVCR